MILKCSLFNGHDCLTPGTKQSRATPRDRVRTVRLRNSKHAGEGAQVFNLNLSSYNVRPPSYVCWLTKAPSNYSYYSYKYQKPIVIGVICTNLAILGASHCKRKATLSIYLSICLSIYPGWWYTYPSEKYESQLGLFFPTSGQTQHVWNHQPVSVGLSIYLSVNLSIYVQIYFPSKSPIAVLSKLNRPLLLDLAPWPQGPWSPLTGAATPSCWRCWWGSREDPSPCRQPRGRWAFPGHRPSWELRNREEFEEIWGNHWSTKGECTHIWSYYHTYQTYQFQVMLH